MNQDLDKDKVFKNVQSEAQDYIRKVYPNPISETQRKEVEQAFIMGSFVGFNFGQDDCELNDLLQFRESLKGYVGQKLVQEFDQ